MKKKPGETNHKGSSPASFLTRRPLFMFLLPVFFVLHGFVENFTVITVKDAVRLVSVYLACTILLFIILAWIYKNKQKAALGCFFVMSVNFFFGSFHDLIKKIFPEGIITKYSILLPGIFVILLISLIGLRKIRTEISKPILFLNLFFGLSIFVDIGLLVYKVNTSYKQLITSSPSFSICRSCVKPDIYLIISDEYAGNETLKNVFGFDNSKFKTELQQRGFFIVPNSSSNYNSTPFSIASILNMSYLSGLDGSRNSKRDINTCYSAIKQSNVLRFLKDEGYRFFNYSIFDFNHQSSITNQTFLPKRTMLLTSQTLTGRIKRDLNYHLITTFGFTSLLKRINNYDLENNKKVFDETIRAAALRIEQPKFVYTHLVLPHFPYYFNKEGERYDWKTLLDHCDDREQYIEYLQYGNTKLLELIDHILKLSQGPPIIVLMGDHGFREFKGPVNTAWLYNNFNAVLMPGKDYSSFYNGVTGVNQFRIIFNEQFNQHLPLLKDSIILITDKIFN